MKFRDLHPQNTPRTILWRALFAIAVGLLGSTLVAVFAGRSRFVELAVVAIGVPLTLAAVNLLAYWAAADTQRKLREAGQAAEAPSPNHALQPTIGAASSLLTSGVDPAPVAAELGSR